MIESNIQTFISTFEEGTIDKNLTEQKADWETEEFTHGIDVLLAEKPLEKMLSKAAEELGELSVKLLQYINKKESINENDIEEEIADVEMHMIVLNKLFPVPMQVREEKVNKFLNSKDYKEYSEINKLRKAQEGFTQKFILNERHTKKGN